MASVNGLQAAGEALVKCQDCKGRGKIKYEVNQIGQPTQKLEMKCVTCDGAKQITKRRAEAIEEGKKIWCSCGNPSEGVTFYKDGEGPEISKHHYRCNDCGKVVQIG